MSERVKFAPSVYEPDPLLQASSQSETDYSMTMYSVASSRTNHMNYGLCYTERALSATSDDYRDHLPWSSNPRSPERGAERSYLQSITAVVSRFHVTYLVYPYPTSLS
ncbi:hypothetical protein CVT25_012663 [Psilocybe cyanescens]|uniref:Uncharacterized protein n=1 Tax=Psilocybe cyanescens TaxID=93625 RepID=A0A409XK70_PSICY|nr:hypothetical protein CVT25_012663 [Psilocybe cyanescens]